MVVINSLVTEEDYYLQKSIITTSITKQIKIVMWFLSCFPSSIILYNKFFIFYHFIRLSYSFNSLKRNGFLYSSLTHTIVSGWPTKSAAAEFFDIPGQ